ncbi:MAG: chemotaxis-specific protein-glutamate methyltransferase CheB [Gemmatimonadota bacterium]|nr:chemotaxis-specific protein-glutamate methyltransferase CheB [Gemmatimonadota bacterium]
MIRVLVAEDSYAARLLIVALLESDPEIEVVGEAQDGEAAVVQARQLRPDVITMDIHMPLLDGLDATARIMSESPVPIVVVSSAVNPRDVASTFDAIKAGALVALPKPGSGTDRASVEERAIFTATVKAMARVKVVRRWSGSFERAGGPPEAQATNRSCPLADQSGASRTTAPPPLPRRAGPAQSVSLIAMAASTGGPTALRTVIAALPGSFPTPIVLVQHIAKGFLEGFACWLDGECAVRVRVARSGETLEPGTVYVAPDDVHLGVTVGRQTLAIHSEPVNGFRPSASVLFESAANAYGAGLAAVILTGMGSDGVSGLRRVRDTGGYVIAQDEATSLIYGMPGESVAAGVVNCSLSVGLIGPHLIKMISSSNV